MAQAAGAEQNWLPIESNPDVMNDYAQKLGWPVESFRFYDVLSTEDWAIDMIPQPVLAVLMLFPIKPESEAHAAKEDAAQAEAAQPTPPSMFFVRQTVANACGTIGVLHTCLNASTVCGGKVALAPDSWLAKFGAATAGLTPDGRAEALEANEELEAAHTEQVGAGQSDVVDDTWNHFVAFLAGPDGCLYELDGRRPRPVNHGLAAPDTLRAATAVIQQYMARDPTELGFTMVALAAATDEEGGGEDGA